MSGSPRSDEESPPAPGSTIISKLGYFSEAVFEMLTDRSLRNKARNLVVSEAGKQMQGVASKATDLRKGFSEGVPRQFQGLISRINKQIQTSRREASLKARRDQPVDVQVGPHLWEDAPQELRSRLWIALLCNPQLIGNLVVEKAKDERAKELQEGIIENQSEDQKTSENKPQVNIELQELTDSLPNGTPVAAEEKNTKEKKAEEKKANEKNDDRSPTADLKDGLEESKDGQQLEESHLKTPVGTKSGSLKPTIVISEEHSGGLGDEIKGNDSAKEEADAWEIVQDNGAWHNTQVSPSLSEQLRQTTSGNAQTLKDKLIVAMYEIDWPISVLYQEGCRYDTLCQISVGQEEIEEVIERDIDRTFPEHPQFSFEQGQQQLFRVLKAYSLHDIQVGYCQGMAFVTGVLLMYVPEEPAFRLLARLMDERGANLRHLYLPGLEGLKNYLRMLEWLLQRTCPDLKEHLEEHNVSPVLFASQWFLTAFSCPFPASFACRVIDVMLTENNGHAMLRVALSVLRACSHDLLELHDFESLITHLKVEPVKWSAQMTRNVLNEAIQGAISDDLLSAATEAVANGYDGSLTRVPASRRRNSEVQPESTEQKSSAQTSVSQSTATLENQISSVTTECTDGEENSAIANDGDISQAVDAMWTVNTAESMTQPEQKETSS